MIYLLNLSTYLGIWFSRSDNVKDKFTAKLFKSSITAFSSLLKAPESLVDYNKLSNFPRLLICYFFYEISIVILSLFFFRITNYYIRIIRPVNSWIELVNHSFSYLPRYLISLKYNKQSYLISIPWFSYKYSFKPPIYTE